MAITLIANVGCPTASTSSAINTTGANYIVAVVGGWVSSASSLTDNKGNTYTLARPRKASPAACELGIFHCFAPTVGSGHTFTVGGTFATACIAAFSGVVQTYTGNTTAGATSLSPGSVSLGTAGGLILSGLTFQVAGTVSINAGLTITNQQNFVGGTAFGSALAYVISSSGTYTPTWTLTSSDYATDLQIVDEAAAGGGSGGAHGFALLG